MPDGANDRTNRMVGLPDSESRPRAPLRTREGLEAQRFGMLARTLSR